MSSPDLSLKMLRLFLIPAAALLVSCNHSSQPTQREYSIVSPGVGSRSQSGFSAQVARPDPAIAMQGRAAFYPSPWPQLSYLDQGSQNFKKLTGTLARIQFLAARNPSVQQQLPTVLINAKNDCLDQLTVGVYKPSCQTIKVDYTDGSIAFEFPVEVEAVLAHEWGHHLATASGLNASGTEHEIVADCFAGVVFGYYVKHRLISSEEGVKALQMMAQISNNSETGIHPNMQNRTSAFMGGMARIADPQGEWGHLYGSTCGSLEQVFDASKVETMGLSWPG